MAHSPSPGPSALPTAHRRPSASPPLTAQPLSKRDKRRTMIDQRLRDIAASFSRERDAHLRTQLNAVARDMHFVTRVDAYQPRLLDDAPDDLSVDVPGPPGAGAGAAEGERIALGRVATGFVDEVNDEMEGRDARITDGDLAFRSQIAHLQLEYDFALQVAEAENAALKDTARTRVVSAVTAKRRAITKEKEQLDVADSTYLMNTHALTALATAPGSPGGAHASRKTRYTRARADPDGLTDGTAGENNGGTSAPNGKRNGKRKAGAAELDYDSAGAGPGPRSTPFHVLAAGPGSLHALGPGSVPSAPGAAFWAPAHPSRALASDPDAPPAADRFFTARELLAANRAAHATVAHAWLEPRPRLAGPPAVAADAAADDDDAPIDYAALVAPAMDRAANSSHATRSTRLNPPPVEKEEGAVVVAAAAVAAALARQEGAMGGGWGGAWGAGSEGAGDGEGGAAEEQRRVFGRAVLEALAIRPRGVASKDLEAPLTRELPGHQVQEDVAILQSLMDAPDE